MAPRTFFVYVLASTDRVLYIGITNNLLRRLVEHRTGATPGFASAHRAHRLVYYEIGTDPVAAIAREKQLKGWKRIRKLHLIESRNPDWEDLAKDWLSP